MPRVQEINHLAELEPHRLRWRKLLGETRGRSYFQTLDWLETYWQHFGGVGRLRVLVIYSGREALGVVPLAVQSRPTRLGNCRVLSYPLLVGREAFYGPIGQHPTACLLAALRHLQQTPRDWDLIQLAGIDPTVDCGRTEHALRRVGWPARCDLADAVAVLRFPAPWPAYWASRSEHCRQTVRRAEAQLAELGTVEYVHFRPQGAAWEDDDPRWELYDACETIARQGSPEQASLRQNSLGQYSLRQHPRGQHSRGQHSLGQRMVGTVSLADEQVRPFLRAVHTKAAQAGTADLHLLKVDGTPVAFAYGYHLDGTNMAIASGVDSAPRFRCAGTVLIARALERCCNLGDRSYNLGGVPLRHKRRWLTDLVRSESYTCYAATPRMQLLRCMRRLMARPATSAPF